jgi:hypothetical protein
MSTLVKFVRKNLLDPVKVINALTAAGLISDNCVHIEDVADADCARAIEWLDTQPYKSLKIE